MCGRLGLLTLEVAEVHADKRFTREEHWQNISAVPAASYDCGYCSAATASGTGVKSDGNRYFVRFCPNCNGPTFFGAGGVQWPGRKLGLSVSGLSRDVQAVHEEARTSIANNAYTGTVMLCRKILMHVAVEKGAKQDLSFQQYVKWLIDERYAPRGAEHWLDYVRNRANEANHEIVVMNREDAEGVLLFTEALLRGVYELPAMVPSTPPKRADEADQETPEREPEAP